MPRVSVLMAVHNDGRFVRLAIESILRQTVADLELIVVDDASTDETPALLSALSDERVEVVTNDRQLGLAASLNIGLDRAAGHYVARIDADDVALPDRLERQLARMRDVAVLGTAVLDLDEAGRLGVLHRNPVAPQAARWLSLFSSPFFHPTVLIDRDALGDLRYDPSYLESEDYELWTRVLRQAEGANLAEPLLLKRVHPGQASVRRSGLQKSFQLQVALREIERVAPELSRADAERAWGGEREPYLALLAAFERTYGVDDEVRDLAARRLGQTRSRLVLRRARRLVDQSRARRRASAWLARLGDPSVPVRVVVVSPEPTPYRSPLFDRVADRPEVDLTVIYAAQTVAGRTWSVEAMHRRTFLAGARFPGLRRVLRHDYPVTPGIGRTLRRLRPDVVVVSGWSTFAAQAAIAWCRMRRVPYILLVESHDLGPRPRWRRTVKGAVVPPVVRGAESVLVVGTAARASVVARGAPPERVRIFANTVDIPAWIERAQKLRVAGSRNRVSVLSVGRLVHEKGFDVLVRAGAEAGVELTLAGDGPGREGLLQLARELDVPLTILGDIAEDELAQRYAQADIFALLSFHETWGVVVNEAAASGLPLVLSDRVGAAYDLLRDGENGFLVPAGDVAVTAAALRNLAVDAELRRKMAERSRELVRGWGYEPSVENFLAAVREAVAG